MQQPGIILPLNLIQTIVARIWSNEDIRAQASIEVLKNLGLLKGVGVAELPYWIKNIISFI